jgi:methyl-accepting chemotaxis protein
VGEALNEISNKARSMDALAEKVSHTSREQAAGIQRIETAVGQIDQIAQGNAAGAEETAAAAEELEAQSRGMRESVAELLVLLGADPAVAAAPESASGAQPRRFRSHRAAGAGQPGRSQSVRSGKFEFNRIAAA